MCGLELYKVRQVSAAATNGVAFQSRRALMTTAAARMSAGDESASLPHSKSPALEFEVRTGLDDVNPICRLGGPMYTAIYVCLYMSLSF